MRTILAGRLLLVSALATGACGSDDDGGGGGPDAGGQVGGDGGACLGAAFEVPNEGWLHLEEGTTIEYDHNPPASGPHYPVWARYEVHEEPLARGYWVHNLEHGAVVLVHRDDAPASVVDDLVAAYEAIPDDPACGHRRALLVSDPELETPVALVAANWVSEGDCVTEDAVLAFTDAHRNRAPEQVCGDGTVP